jgi:hypothetical protein
VALTDEDFYLAGCDLDQEAAEGRLQLFFRMKNSDQGAG